MRCSADGPRRIASTLRMARSSIRSARSATNEHAPCATWRLVEPSALPGFGPALGFTLAYLSFFVLLPLTALVLRPWEAGFDHFWRVMTDERTIEALRLSFGASFIAACINVVFGTIVAWVLVRYEFPGRRLFDAFVDLPFALPTAVAGISLAAIYAPNGVIGALFDPHDIQIAYTPLGVMIALVFVGFPFIVRSIQPVLEDLDVKSRRPPRHWARGASRPSCRSWRQHTARGAGGLFALLRAGGGRVRLGDLHRRQHPERLGDRAASHRDPARRV